MQGSDENDSQPLRTGKLRPSGGGAPVGFQPQMSIEERNARVVEEQVPRIGGRRPGIFRGAKPRRDTALHDQLRAEITPPFAVNATQVLGAQGPAAAEGR